MTSAAEGPGPGDGLGDLFWLVARRLRHDGRRSMAPWGVTPAQMRALRTLARQGELRAGELARHLDIAPRSATEVIDRLEERGLVERRPDPDDRRAVLAALSGRGRELFDEMRAARGRRAEELFDALDPADRRHLERILRQLVR